MSTTKVFVSSTCFDLADIRESLRKFIINLGHEPVMSDYSDIVYDPRNHTHTSCLKEVENCDLLVLIIGGRYGGTSVNEAVSAIDFKRLEDMAQIKGISDNAIYSITHLEFLKAVECRIPIYTFIKKDVLSDHKLYQNNQNSSILDQIIFPSIEKKETARYIFEFINTVRRRSVGNNIFPFDSIVEIESVLKKQWSGYFQKLLKEQMINSKVKSTRIGEKNEEELRELIKIIIAELPRDQSLPRITKLTNRRILWVDDYPINNEAVINYFMRQNIQFDLALSTAQGLDLINRFSYDIVITDMGRGHEKDAGIRLIRALKDLHCRIPIIVYCSIPAMERYGAQALELGAYSVTNGPINIISLISDIYGLKG